MKHENPEPEHEEEVRELNKQGRHEEQLLPNDPESCDGVRKSVRAALSEIIAEIDAAKDGTDFGAVFMFKVGDHVTAGVGGPLRDLAHMIHEEMCHEEHFAEIFKAGMVAHFMCQATRNGNLEGMMAAAMLQQLFFPESSDSETPDDDSSEEN